MDGGAPYLIELRWSVCQTAAHRSAAGPEVEALALKPARILAVIAVARLGLPPLARRSFASARHIT